MTTYRDQAQEEHHTYVEHDGRGYYWWCEAADCYASERRRYASEGEARDAAAEHEAHPG